VDGAQERLPAAEVLKKKLELILEGEGFPDKDNPEKSYGYDIFVRWKPLEKQPIGWDPDLNDGVRLNIRPFMTVGDVKKKRRGSSARQAKYQMGQRPRQRRGIRPLASNVQRRPH